MQTQAAAAGELGGEEIINSLIKARIEFIPVVPDITTSAGLLWPLSKRSEFKLIRLAKEDEGVSICSSLFYCGKRSLLLMQQTGLFDSLNAVRGIAVAYKQPICMMIGLLGKEPDRSPKDSTKYSVRIVEPVLDAMEVDHVCIESNEDAPRITAAIDRAYEISRPVAILLGKRIRK